MCSEFWICVGNIEKWLNRKKGSSCSQKDCIKSLSYGMTSFMIRINPNPLPTGARFGFIRCGGDKRDRTADLLNAIQALSQLSYTPMEVLFTLSGEVSLARCLIIIAELGGFVKKNFRVFLLSRRTPRPPGYMAVYFRNPATICSSACSSVRPRVMSLMIWSPAILPMAASWTRLASTLLAVISGMAWT